MEGREGEKRVREKKERERKKGKAKDELGLVSYNLNFNTQETEEGVARIKSRD